MEFIETKLKGAYVVVPKLIGDTRGFFAETFSAREFEKHGLVTRIAQCNLAGNARKGTLRGMHYQIAPATEVKFIRCIKGAIYDVIVDLREGSPTYLQHFGVELTADNRKALYIPEMFAHGYQTLTDDTEVAYNVSEFYAPEHARGLRYDDPKLAIQWPLPVSDMSDRDKAWAYLK
jgi:dTDP-4-dehydrorhamnose 3,5-epimerase